MAKRGKRSYNQYCALARALDVIGERWTLLLIRELLLGPKRYKDLLAGLPGIGTNLLAERLRALEALGLIERRTLPPPAGSTVYELTDVGRGLEPAVMELGRWGARFLGQPSAVDAMQPGWFFVSIRATFRPRLAARVTESYEFRIAGETFNVVIEKGRLSVGQGAARAPDVIVSTDLETFIGLLAQQLQVADVVASGAVEIEGDAGALHHFVDIFAWPLTEEAVST
jgi:DNA-binding HxlR family transcriptional regulator/putative sterol carrier protein